MSNILVRNKNLNRGKEVLHTNAENRRSTKTKAMWDRTTTKMFIDACLEQANKGECNERSMSKKGWRDAMTNFSAISGRYYEKGQFKNKWDSLRKDWSAWYNLFQHETGVGWNYDTYTVIADSNWWDAKEKVNPHYAKYRNEGLPFARELTYLFKDKTATGHFGMASSGFMDNHEEDEQCTPGFESVGMENNEGSGDSDDPNIGVDQCGMTSGGGGGGGGGGGSSIGLTNINLSGNIGRARSGEKRKREGEKIKKGKMDSGTIIGQELKKVADAIQSHSHDVLLKTQIQDPCSIGIVMADIHKLEAVVEDADFYGRCCELMMNKAAREVFAAIPDDEHKLIFLKRAAYKDK